MRKLSFKTRKQCSEFLLKMGLIEKKQDGFETFFVSKKTSKNIFFVNKYADGYGILKCSNKTKRQSRAKLKISNFRTLSFQNLVF